MHPLLLVVLGAVALGGYLVATGKNNVFEPNEPMPPDAQQHYDLAMSGGAADVTAVLAWFQATYPGQFPIHVTNLQTRLHQLTG